MESWVGVSCPCLKFLKSKEARLKRISAFLLIPLFCLTGCMTIQLDRHPSSGYAASNQSGRYPAALPGDRHAQIRNFEKRLETRREKEQYFRMLPWFANDNERIEYL